MRHIPKINAFTKTKITKISLLQMKREPRVLKSLQLLKTTLHRETSISPKAIFTTVYHVISLDCGLDDGEIIGLYNDQNNTMRHL